MKGWGSNKREPLDRDFYLVQEARQSSQPLDAGAQAVECEAPSECWKGGRELRNTSPRKGKKRQTTAWGIHVSEGPQKHHDEGKKPDTERMYSV